MNKKVLFFLVLIAVVLRLVKLDYAPPHLSNDEIGAAYTGYSILKTSKDGYGKYLPLLWKSHGGYGSPLAVYLPILTLAALGNSDLAVRLPSVILGGLTIVFLGLIVYEITKNKRLSIVTSLILAYSPWHFAASRSALESNYALFFLVFGVYLFYVGMLRKKDLVTFLSFIVFTLSIYSYYTEWVLTPLIVLSLVILYRQEVFRKKVYLFGFLAFILLSLPLFKDFVQNLNSSRASSEFITKDLGLSQKLNNYSNPLQKGQIVLTAVLDKYSSYMGLDYLFFDGARLLPKENPYQFGFFLAPLVVGFSYGLFVLKKYYGRHNNFFYVLLLISPLVAAMTQGDINNWRSLPQLFPVAIITGAGSLYYWDRVKKDRRLQVVVILLLLLSSAYLFLTYFKHFPLQRAVGYQYGYKQISQYINNHYTDFEKIIIDQRFGNNDYYFTGVPSAYIPFYTNMDPTKVQEAEVVPNGIMFDKYEFRNINWDAEKINDKYLYIVPYDILPNPESNLTLRNEIFLPNQKPAFRLYSQKAKAD